MLQYVMYIHTNQKKDKHTISSKFLDSNYILARLHKTGKQTKVCIMILTLEAPRGVPEVLFHVELDVKLLDCVG